VRKTVKDRYSAFDDLVKAIREFRKYTELNKTIALAKGVFDMLTAHVPLCGNTGRKT
jgi:hypothetical protein